MGIILAAHYQKVPVFVHPQWMRAKMGMSALLGTAYISNWSPASPRFTIVPRCVDHEALWKECFGEAEVVVHILLGMAGAGDIKDNAEIYVNILHSLDGSKISPCYLEPVANKHGKSYPILPQFKDPIPSGTFPGTLNLLREHQRQQGQQ